MKILSPNQNTAMPSIKKALWVLKPTYFHPNWEVRIAGAPVGEFDFYKLSWPRKVLVSKSVVQHLRANPRTTTYMLHAALQFFGEHAPNAEIDILADQVAEASIPNDLRQSIHTIWGSQNRDFRPWPTDLIDQLKQHRYDTIILLYADAIGWGWQHVESQLEKLGAKQVLIVNGRKRVFFYDGESSSKLRWRRFLERFWPVELAATPVLLLISIPLAIYDLTIRKIIAPTD